MLSLLLALAPSVAQASPPKVRLGIDLLLAERVDLIAGKKVGLVTNPSGVDGEFVPTIDRLARDERFELVQLFGPEHGVRGTVPAGDAVADARDPRTGVPIESLYGRSRRPSAEALARVDVVLFDLQDVGSRTYTFVSTLGEVMRACADAGKPVIVLDRPNPLGGARCEGPLIDDEHRSFIGWSPMPLLHGMTVGEVARFYRGALGIDCPLEVVAMGGWKRAMVWQDTGLTWVTTSPHIPRTLQAQLYACTGMVASTFANVSDGVGSTQPFELCGGEFVDGERLAAELRSRGLRGLRFRAHAWKPFYGAFAGRELAGVQLVLDDPRALRPVDVAVELVCALARLHGEQVEFAEPGYVARHWGSTRFLDRVRGGASAGEILAAFATERAEFERSRARWLLYE